jgi:hypothetical protein
MEGDGHPVGRSILKREGEIPMQIPGQDQEDVNIHPLAELVQFHSELWELMMKAYALPMVTTPGSLEGQQIGMLVRLLISILMRKGIVMTKQTTKEGH